MQKNKPQPSFIRRVGVDILGILLIISSALFGWLPGPGGIPLFLAGLSLLATNHEWARKLLEYFKSKGMDIIESILTFRPWVPTFLDVVAVLFVSSALFILMQTTRNVLQSVAIFLTFSGIGIFLVNRKRLGAINSYVRSVRRRFRKSPKS